MSRIPPKSYHGAASGSAGVASVHCDLLIVKFALLLFHHCHVLSGASLFQLNNSLLLCRNNVMALQ